MNLLRAETQLWQHVDTSLLLEMVWEATGKTLQLIKCTSCSPPEKLASYIYKSQPSPPYLSYFLLSARSSFPHLETLFSRKANMLFPKDYSHNPCQDRYLASRLSLRFHLACNSALKIYSPNTPLASFYILARLQLLWWIITLSFKYYSNRTGAMLAESRSEVVHILEGQVLDFQLRRGVRKVYRWPQMKRSNIFQQPNCSNAACPEAPGNLAFSSGI